MDSDAVGWMTELGPRARRLVAAFRNAAVALQDGRDFGPAVEDDLAGALGRRCCQGAIPDFHALMETIGLHARREIRFHVPQCPCLGGDEAAFLRLHAWVSAGALAEAETIALELVERHAAMTLLHFTSRIAVCCPGGAADAGMAVDERPAPGRCTPGKPAGGVH